MPYDAVRETSHRSRREINKTKRQFLPENRHHAGEAEKTKLHALSRGIKQRPLQAMSRKLRQC